MEDSGTPKYHNQQPFEPRKNNSVVLGGKGDAFYDDDGRLKRTGTLWTASAHIVTAVIGSGVLSLAWAIAQLGWIAGPVVTMLFSAVTYYTSTLLVECYRTGDPINGNRNPSYMDEVRSYLGGKKVNLCGCIQYANLFGVSIGYTIASAISMTAIEKSNCFHRKGRDNPCPSNSNAYTIAFGISEIFLSQIPDFDQIWWLSIVAAVMSFTYSGIGLGLAFVQIVENKGFKGTLTGIPVGDVTAMQKVWQILQALGNIAFAYSFALILVEIQDTIKAPPPSEATVMKKASLLSIIVTTIFYMFCSCLGYGAFGNDAPGNLLTGFGFYNPFWLIDIANAAIVIHLVGAYQVFCQPFFSFIEGWAARTWPSSTFFTREIALSLGGDRPYKLNLFRLVWRSVFVVVTTIMAMLFPFFNDVVGLLGAIGFWPLTVFFPVEMYIVQKSIPAWSTRWVCMRLLSLVCFFVSVSAAVGSIAGIASALERTVLRILTETSKPSLLTPSLAQTLLFLPSRSSPKPPELSPVADALRDLASLPNPLILFSRAPLSRRPSLATIVARRRSPPAEVPLRKRLPAALLPLPELLPSGGGSPSPSTLPSGGASLLQRQFSSPGASPLQRILLLQFLSTGPQRSSPKRRIRSFSPLASRCLIPRRPAAWSNIADQYISDS